MPTIVNKEFLKAIVLNFGGQEQDDVQKEHYNLKYSNKNWNIKYQVPVFMKNDPK